jgi:hypothetical protein
MPKTSGGANDHDNLGMNTVGMNSNQIGKLFHAILVGNNIQLIP